jgi:hypothetical protein
MEILETVKREWGVLSEAPWSFVSLVFVVGLVVAGFVKLNRPGFAGGCFV